MTFGDPTFKDENPDGSMFYDGYWIAPSSEVKEGTIVTPDSSDRVIKVVDTSATDVGDLNYYPMVLITRVRDYSSDVYGYRARIAQADIVGVSEYVNVLSRPGHVLVIGEQNSTDAQAGYVVSSAISCGTQLYTSLSSAGAADGGITDAVSRTVSGTVYYGQPVGIAKNAVTASSGTLLEFVYFPQVLGA